MPANSSDIHFSSGSSERNLYIIRVVHGLLRNAELACHGPVAQLGRTLDAGQGSLERASGF